MLVTLIFGGNQGDRKALIGEAITEMSSIGKIELCSSLYETAPWGFKSSNFYLKSHYILVPMILFIIKLLLTKQIYFQKKFWINVRPQNKNSDESAPVLSSVPEPWI